MACFKNNSAQIVFFYTLLMVLSHSLPATSQLVGCGPINCTGWDYIPVCEVENRTLSALGSGSFNSSYIKNGTKPLTWTLGIQEMHQPSVEVVDQSFYLGVPQNISLTTTIAFGACALFFTDMAANLTFIDPDEGTCQDAMGADCVRDLISLAKQQMSTNSSMSKNGAVDPQGFCNDLAVALYTKPPKTCSVPLGRSQDSIHVDVLTGSSASPPITDLGYCHPTTGKNYTVSMVESYRSVAPYGTQALNSTLHGVTPVMTVFYPNSSSQQAMPVDVHLTCLTVVGVNFSATLATDSVEGTGVRAVNVWSFVGLGLMSAMFLGF